MAGNQYTKEQIADVLRQVESGISVRHISQKTGISEPTLYSWKKKYIGLHQEDLPRLKELENENLKLKKAVADLTIYKQILCDVLGKKRLKAMELRELIRISQ
jgi:putative transposase